MNKTQKYRKRLGADGRRRELIETAGFSLWGETGTMTTQFFYSNMFEVSTTSVRKYKYSLDAHTNTRTFLTFPDRGVNI